MAANPTSRKGDDSPELNHAISSHRPPVRRSDFKTRLVGLKACATHGDYLPAPPAALARLALIVAAIWSMSSRGETPNQQCPLPEP